MRDLVAFLRARLDDDEQAAREAAVWWGDADEPGEAPHWRPVPCGHIWNDQDGGIADEVADRHAAHIARHDPARVLAEVEAKRRMVDEHGNGTCRTLRLLALPYADHPDYRPEWRNDRPTT